MAKRFIEVAGDGETEIRQVFEAPPGHDARAVDSPPGS